MADILCIKCGKVLQDKQFYKNRAGKPIDICKKCLTLHVDVTRPETYMWILEKLDVIYLEEEFNITINKDYAKKGADNFNHAAALGKYLAKMKLNPWNQYGFKDSEKIKQEREAKKEEIKQQEEAFSNNLLEQFQNGQISEYEYKTLTTVAQQESERDHFAADPKIAMEKDKKNAAKPNGSGDVSFYDEEQFISEEELPDPAEELTKEDKVYLAMKWGRLYKPAEWIDLEATYDEYSDSFTVDDPDTEKALIMICKTILKMNQCIDAGDIETYQKLSRVYDAMRKSTKFTAVQNKEDKNDAITSIGELIVMCEQNGFVPQFATDIPQDKVDYTLKDMNNYINKLVTHDLGFGDQIENAIKMLKLRAEEEERANIEEDKEIESLGDKDITEYFDELETQRLVDIEREQVEEPEELDEEDQPYGFI